MGGEAGDHLVNLLQQVGRRTADQIFQFFEQYGDLVVLGPEYGDRVGQLRVLRLQRGEQAGGFARVVVVEALAEGEAVDAELSAETCRHPNPAQPRPVGRRRRRVRCHAVRPLWPDR
jgi:hypothetical protein